MSTEPPGRFRSSSSTAAGSREEVLVPFAKSYLRRIDLDHKRVEMALPEGLIDLNASS